MNFKGLMKHLFCFSLMFICSITFAVTELEQLIATKYSGKPKQPTLEDIREILAACRKDQHSNQTISPKEKSICADFFKSEQEMKNAYRALMKACAYQKIKKSADLPPNFYDQYFVNYLAKHHAIYLVDSRNPSDVMKLNAYKKACVNELMQKLLPPYIKECQKEHSFDLFYASALKNIKML